jgi:hypothetical protein
MIAELCRRRADLSDEDKEALSRYAESLRGYVKNEGESDFLVIDVLAVLDRLLTGAGR